tara:strand:+ start:1643 stop:2014 length:372 start_codon:yes stop_codon:yes gene_type:complete
METSEEIEQFKTLVCEWVKLDDIIRTKNNELKEIKNDKKQLEEYILGCMDKLEENVIDISDGKLRVNKTKSKSGLNKNYLQESLAELTQDPVQATNMTKHILDNRPTTERVNLKRTFNRKSTN